jgi:hypothetical protein
MTERHLLLRKLSQQREALLRSVEGLSVEQIREPGAGGPGWSAQDVLGHIAAWERQTVETIRAYMTGTEPYHIEGFDDLADRDRWNEEEVAQRRNWPVHETLVELGVVRSELLVQLADLTEAQLDDRIVYPWGKAGRLSRLLELGADHEREHTTSLAAWRATIKEPTRAPIA